MGFLSFLGPVMELIGSDIGYNADQHAYNAAQNAAGQDAAAASKIDNSIENTIGGAWGNASSYWLNEAKTGLDPAVTAAAMNNYNNSNQRDLSSIQNQFGSNLPNLSGTLEDLRGQELQGGLQLQGQLAGMNQGVRDSAMSNYFGGALAQAGPLMNISNQYMNAASGAANNAQNAFNGMQQNNPFTAFGNAMSGMNFGSMFGGGGGGGGVPQGGYNAGNNSLPSYNPFGNPGGGFV